MLQLPRTKGRDDDVLAVAGQLNSQLQRVEGVLVNMTTPQQQQVAAADLVRHATDLVRHAIDRLRRVIQLGIVKVDFKEIFHVCILLAKAIDSAVAYNQAPAVVNDLPHLLKQVFERKGDIPLQPAIMVLMLSVKNACKSGWFRVTDTNELLTMSKEISSYFTNIGEFPTSETSNSMHIISTIIPRFYPQLSLGSILVSLEAKPGYEVLATDFHIAKRPASNEKIRLFVTRTDNLETSSCLVTPPQVNFLLNGKGVEKRSILSVDTGPQMPTDVTSMLKIGTNLLQAIGDFNGHYMIAVTIMSACPSASPPSKLCDYVPLVASSLPPDDDLTEGPSRVTLHCPISYRRIVTPVKGSMCRHHQCFDYENFMEINSRRPSWRCPYCNRNINCPDLRIDQKMVKVLKEVGENVADVLIFADGSWKAMTRHDNIRDQLHESEGIDAEDDLVSREFEGKASITNNVIDLTTQNSESRGMNNTEGQSLDNISISGSMCVDAKVAEDKKPDSETLRKIYITAPSRNTSFDNATLQTINRETMQVETDNLTRDISSGTSTIPVPRREHLCPAVVSDNSFASVLTDAIIPQFSRGTIEAHDFAQTVNPLQSLPSTRYLVPTENRDLQMVNSMLGNSSTSIEAERHSSRHISRAPIAIQALPAQTQVANTFTRPRTSSNHSNPVTQIGISSNNSQVIALLASSNNNFETSLHSDLEMQQLLTRQIQQASLDLPASSPIHFQAQPQSRELQERQHWISHSVQPSMTIQSPTQNGGRNNLDQQRISTTRNSLQLCQDQQNQQQILNQLIHQTFQRDSFLRHQQRLSPQFQQPAQSGPRQPLAVSGLVPSPLLNQHPHIAQRTVPNTRPPQMQFSRSLPATNIAFQRSNTTSNIDHSRITGGDIRLNSSTTAPVISRAEVNQEAGIEQTWRPTGRMRGSIVGAGRVANNSTNPFLNQQITSGHYRAFIGPTQPNIHAGLLSSTHPNIMQRPPSNTWNGDLLNANPVWNSNDVTHLRPAGGNMATQVQNSDPDNTNLLTSSDLEWLFSDIQMQPNDGSQMQS